MHKSEFTSLITDPARISKVEIESLEEIVRQFPYCQPAHLLLARKLHDDNSMSFEKQLNVTAAYAPSRTALYHLLNDTRVSVEEDLMVDRTDSTSVAEAVDTVEDPVGVKSEGTKDELDQLIRAEAASAYRLEEEVEEEIHLKETAAKEEAGTKAFADWIRFLEGEEEKQKEDNAALIDQFIKEEPRIAPLRKEDGSKENLARSSSEELPDELVTETLARIHLEQGNRGKAIEIYERLKLKYPEKSPYFAAQIEFIKQK